jgi:hypothetical protein
MTPKFLGNRIAPLVAAGAVGAGAGALVFAVSQLAGRNLYIVIGAAAGIAAVLVLQFFWRTAQLSEVKITVPQISELTFVVNNDARQVAWKLYVETVTRVATQSLADTDGYLREALTSLHGLFGVTRDTLKASRPSVPAPGSQTVEYLAVTMLNHQLRPLLSKWHPRLREFEKAHPDSSESDWSDNLACRAALRQVQDQLVQFALGFANLAGVRGADSMVQSARPIAR